jgi:hypothetical protein
MTNRHDLELNRARAARERAEAQLRDLERLRPRVEEAVSAVVRFRTENHLVEMILDAFGRPGRE